IRVIIQAFTYAAYKPRPADLYAWTSQALRAGATDISFYTLGDPRFTNKPLYAAILDIALRMRGGELPAFPSDPGTLVVYATASEGKAQPERAGDARYRTSGDALYTTYSYLGELAHGDFVFDSDTRLTRDPSRLAAAHTVWLPRADTLDRPFAERLLGWVRGGGTLIVTDPRAFTRAPDGSSLASLRNALIGAPLGRPRTGDIVFVQPDALAEGLPGDLLTLPMDSAINRAFAAVPAGATVVGRFIDDSPAIIERSVGRGRVVAFASDPMA